MAINTFDVTVAQVAAMIGHLGTITASSSPTLATTTAWIEQVAAQVDSVLRLMSIDPAAVTSTSTSHNLALYHQSRLMVAKMVAALWHGANKNGDTSLAAGYRIQFDDWLAAMRENKLKATGSEANLFQSSVTVNKRYRSNYYR